MDRELRSGRQFSATERLPFVAAPQGERAVELAALDIQVVVTGLYAETTQTMRFFNPNDRDIEGNLTFPLPDRAVVCGYALDVDGRMVDGVVVPKQEARRILEAEERKGIDPGLVEQVQGNVYRTRIYPLPARGTRTIKLVYISDLTVSGDDAAYHLPLAHATAIDEVSLRVEVQQAPVAPTISGGVGNLSLEQWDTRWVAEAKLTRGMPAEDLQVRLPSLPAHVSVVETVRGETYFSVSCRVSAAEGLPWAPKRIGLLWDASGSRTDVSRDLAFLEALLVAWPSIVVDVRVVRDALDRDVDKTFSAGDEPVQALLDHLRGLPRDGATNLGGIDLGSLTDHQVDAWLVFSDGMDTVGRGLPQVGATPVFAISSQSHCHAAYLAHIANESGGVHVNLLRTTPGAAANAIASWRDALRLERAAGCADVNVSSSHSRFVVTGRLVEKVGSVQLTGPGAPSDHVAVSTSAAQPGHAIARAWAGQHAQRLALLGPSTAFEVVALGRAHGLVTPGTSLLVLESLDQYIEYTIEPPATQPEMRAAYLAHLAGLADEEKSTRDEHIEDVVGMWRHRIQWWEEDFDAARKAKKQRRDENATGGGPEGELILGAPPPAPMRMMAMAELRPDAAAEPEPTGMDTMMAEEAKCDAFDDAFEDDEREEAPSAKKAAPAKAEASIRIKAWSPDTPYLTAMRSVPTDATYATYLAQRAEYAESPAFFFDCADYLLSSAQRALGLRVLSNIIELAIGDAAMLRMYAWRLQQAGELDAAIEVFEQVRQDRGDEPQSHRDLALALGLRWERDREPGDAVRAIELLYEVATREWDRFPEIEVIALLEMNRLIHLACRDDVAVPEDIDERLIASLDLDLRISMSWDADLTDVDLHVFEPTGEHAYYGHNLTEIGGLVSRDFTEGYGPEEYVLHKAAPGVYTIKAHYYGSHQQQLTGACTVIVNVFTNYGRGDEQRQVLTLRLEQASDEALVGEIDVGGGRDVPDEPGDEAWRRRFASLRKGMTLDEITGVVGQPAEIRGSIETILVYRPAPAVEIHVTAAPTLTGVQQLMDGARLDLISLV